MKSASTEALLWPLAGRSLSRRHVSIELERVLCQGSGFSLKLSRLLLKLRLPTGHFEMDLLELFLAQLVPFFMHGRGLSQGWWAMQGSNLRPFPCEGNVLPLN